MKKENLRTEQNAALQALRKHPAIGKNQILIKFRYVVIRAYSVKFRYVQAASLARGGEEVAKMSRMRPKCTTLPRRGPASTSPWLVFVALPFFYMKVHSLIHASEAVVFLLFSCAVYRYFGCLLFFPGYKTRPVAYFFRGGQGRELAVRELFIAYPTERLSVIPVCYELCPMTLPTPCFFRFH